MTEIVYFSENIKRIFFIFKYFIVESRSNISKSALYFTLHIPYLLRHCYKQCQSLYRWIIFELPHVTSETQLLNEYLLL